MKTYTRTLPIAVAALILGMSAQSASAGLFRRNVVVATPVYAAPTTVYAAPAPVYAAAPAATVVEAPVQAVYTPQVVAPAPVQTNYTTTTLYSAPAPLYAQPMRVVYPRRVYRYGY